MSQSRKQGKQKNSSSTILTSLASSSQARPAESKKAVKQQKRKAAYKEGQHGKKAKAVGSNNADQQKKDTEKSAWRKVFEAAWHGDVSKIEAIFRENALTEQQIQRIVNKPANAKHDPNHQGFTPLLNAVKRGHENATRVLLNRGGKKFRSTVTTAPITAGVAAGKTAFRLAADHNQIGILKLLVDDTVRRHQDKMAESGETTAAAQRKATLAGWNEARSLLATLQPLSRERLELTQYINTKSQTNAHPPNLQTELADSSDQIPPLPPKPTPEALAAIRTKGKTAAGHVCSSLAELFGSTQLNPASSSNNIFSTTPPLSVPPSPPLPPATGSHRNITKAEDGIGINGMFVDMDELETLFNQESETLKPGI